MSSGGEILLSGGVGALLGVVAAGLLQPSVNSVIEEVGRRLRRRRGTSLPLDGIWHSRYQYVTAEFPGTTLIDEHFLVLRQRRGDRVEGTSLSRPEASKLTIDLDIEGSVLTGTWREYTPSRREYHGACQFELDPTRDGANGHGVTPVVRSGACESTSRPRSLGSEDSNA